MARFHKGVIMGAIGVAGIAVFAAWAVPTTAGSFLSGLWGKDETPVVVSQEPAFTVKVGEKPQEEKEPVVKSMRLSDKVNALKEDKKESGTKSTQLSLRETWLKNVNSKGTYAFGEDTGDRRGAYNSGGACSTLQPLRARAMIADNGTTDQPGLAMGIISEDIQGQEADGTWCVAVHEYAIVAFRVDKAGEYATKRAPVHVEKIWLKDGQEVVVDQPAKHIDGIAGVIGEVDHHTMEKTGAAIAGGFFRVIDNLSSVAQYRVSSGDVTDPLEDMLRKTLERPSEVTFGSQVVEFDLMPTSTPGY